MSSPGSRRLVLFAERKLMVDWTETRHPTPDLAIRLASGQPVSAPEHMNRPIGEGPSQWPSTRRMPCPSITRIACTSAANGHARSGDLIDVVQPATEDVWVRVAAAGKGMCPGGRRGPAGLRPGPWPRMTHAERAQYLRAIATGLRERPRI